MSLIKFHEYFFSGLVSYEIVNPVGKQLIKESFSQLVGSVYLQGFLLCISTNWKRTLIYPTNPRYHASSGRVDFPATRSKAIKLATEVLQVFLLVLLFCLFPAVVGKHGSADTCRHRYI